MNPFNSLKLSSSNNNSASSFPSNIQPTTTQSIDFSKLNSIAEIQQLIQSIKEINFSHRCKNYYISKKLEKTNTTTLKYLIRFFGLNYKQIKARTYCYCLPNKSEKTKLIAEEFIECLSRNNKLSKDELILALTLAQQEERSNTNQVLQEKIQTVKQNNSYITHYLGSTQTSPIKNDSVSIRPQSEINLEISQQSINLLNSLLDSLKDPITKELLIRRQAIDFSKKEYCINYNQSTKVASETIQNFSLIDSLPFLPRLLEQMQILAKIFDPSNSASKSVEELNQESDKHLNMLTAMLSKLEIVLTDSVSYELFENPQLGSEGHTFSQSTITNLKTDANEGTIYNPYTRNPLTIVGPNRQLNEVIQALTRLKEDYISKITPISVKDSKDHVMQDRQVGQPVEELVNQIRELNSTLENLQLELKIEQKTNPQYLVLENRQLTKKIKFLHNIIQQMQQKVERPKVNPELTSLPRSSDPWFPSNTNKKEAIRTISSNLSKFIGLIPNQKYASELFEFQLNLATTIPNELAKQILNKIIRDKVCSASDITQALKNIFGDSKASNSDSQNFPNEDNQEVGFNLLPLHGNHEINAVINKIRTLDCSTLEGEYRLAEELSKLSKKNLSYLMQQYSNHFKGKYFIKYKDIVNQCLQGASLLTLTSKFVELLIEEKILDKSLLTHLLQTIPVDLKAKHNPEILNLQLQNQQLNLCAKHARKAEPFGFFNREDLLSEITILQSKIKAIQLELKSLNPAQAGHVLSSLQSQNKMLLLQTKQLEEQHAQLSIEGYNCYLPTSLPEHPNPWQLNLKNKCSLIHRICRELETFISNIPHDVYAKEILMSLKQQGSHLSSCDQGDFVLCKILFEKVLSAEQIKEALIKSQLKSALEYL